MTLLNFAIFQKNNGASKSKVDGILQQFYQSYTMRASSVTQRGLDPAMLEIAGRLVAPSVGASSHSSAQPSAPKAPVPAQYEQPDTPSTSIFSPRKPIETRSHEEDNDDRDNEETKKPAQELPVVKTKIFDDGRPRRPRGRDLPGLTAQAEPAQNEGQDESTVF